MDCIQRSGFPAEDEWQHLGVHIFECAGGSCSFFVAKSAVRKELVFSFRGTTSGNQLLWQVYMGLLHDAWDFPNPDELKKSRGFGDLLHMDKLKSFLTMKPWGKIHKYFGQAFYQIWPDLRAAYCLPKEYKDYTFIFTGHSLGGALASLAAAQTLVENYKKSDQIVLYTFGQPRIGNYAFAMRHSQMIPNSYRIVNGEDGVVHVGPCRKNVPSPQFLKCYSQITDHPLAETKKICIHNESKFYHQGTEVWFNEEMVYDWRGVKHKVCRGMPQNEDIGCSAGVDFDRNRVKFYYTHHSFYYGKMVSAFGKSGCKIERNPFKRVFEQKKSEALLERELFKEMNGGNGANVDAETRHKAFDEMADRIEELQKMDEENDEEAAFSEEMRFEDIHQMSLVGLLASFFF